MEPWPLFTLHHTHQPIPTNTDTVTNRHVTAVMPAAAPAEKQLSSFRFSDVISENKCIKAVITKWQMSKYNLVYTPICVSCKGLRIFSINYYPKSCKDPLLIGDKTHAQIALTPIRDKILICQTFRSILRPSSVAI